MKEYRRVIDFNYGNERYCMLIDQVNKHFFLKYVDGKLTYITIEELEEITKHLGNIPLIMNVKKDGFKKKLIVPAVIVGGSLVLLTSNVLDNYFDSKNKTEEIDSSTVAVSEYISVSDELDVPDELVVDTYLESDLLNYLYIYDNNYLSKALDYDNVSLEELEAMIQSNTGISSKFKSFLKEFCSMVLTKYPDLDMRVFYENLKTLEIVECTKNELMLHSLSVDSYGCYIVSENKIYVLEDYSYEKGTWDYQVLIHELCHAMRTGMWEKDGLDIRVTASGLNFENTITNEALNSLFAVSLFDYEENDIAYQLQSNYHKLILQCLDNYDISDYMEHSISYYAKCLDDYNNQDNYATYILELIQFQYDDFHSEKITVEQAEYYPIYEYICNMYFGKFISSSMSFDEALDVYNSMIDTMLFDVSEEYNIDKDYIYSYFLDYIDDLNIVREDLSR